MNLVSYYSLYQHKMFCKFLTKALQQNKRNCGLRNLFDGYQRKILYNIFLTTSINRSLVEVCYADPQDGQTQTLSYLPDSIEILSKD